MEITIMTAISMQKCTHAVASAIHDEFTSLTCAKHLPTVTPSLETAIIYTHHCYHSAQS